jgi:hypothetical protein
LLLGCFKCCSSSTLVALACHAFVGFHGQVEPSKYKHKLVRTVLSVCDS